MERLEKAFQQFQNEPRKLFQQTYNGKYPE